MNKHGGKVIGSGGFGCVFKPSIKCKHTINSSTNYISKLMLTKNAKEEIEEMKKYIIILKLIPKYKHYFLVDNIEVCQPEILTEKDLTKFDSDCTALIKHGITKQNINDKLYDLMAINMPYGGVSVGSYVEKHHSFASLTELHLSLIDLLQNGIIPMNKKDLYHCDIKSANVLVKEGSINKEISTKEGSINNDSNKKTFTRIIDWGLSVHYTNKKEVPDNLFKRPFQFNLPFSIILFSDDFVDSYTRFLSTNTSPKTFQMREFTINFIYDWIKKRGMGHLKAINKRISMLYDKELTKSVDDKNTILKYDFTYYHIIEYISTILCKFTKNGKFYIEEYFNNVFIQNVDIYGFIWIYYPIVELLYEHYESLSENDLELFSNLRYLFIHYLFEISATPIPVNELISFLKKITILFSQSTISNLTNENNNSISSSRSSNNIFALSI